ncbi:MAG: SRPBCC family protein [Bacillota bacterium]|nr:SRPBCC family protein [Bacillota bacterium]
MALLVSHRSRIPAPVPVVWEVVADPFRRPEWMAGVTGVHGEPPPAKPCLAEQRFTLEGWAGLWRFTAREKVTAVWPGTMVAFHGETGPASYLLTFTLSELGGEHTSLVWNMEVRPAHAPPSLLTRLALRLVRWAADRLARRSLANLRTCLKQGPGGGMGKYGADNAIAGE